MKFIHRIFPFRSIIELDENTLTAYVSLIIILLFLYFCYRLWTVTRRLKKRLRSFNKNFEINEIQQDTYLASTWNDYSDTFIDFDGEKKTDENAHVFFNDSSLLAANTNLKLINAVPSTLVGIGILGTFIGLTFGISGFETDNTEMIKDSIDNLLAGMGTAFISSIYGMVFSLIFTFIEKMQVHSLHHSIHVFCFTLDKRFKITKEQERTLLWKRQKDLLHDFFIYTDEKGNEIRPSSVLRDLYYESTQQSAALESFSTDLAEMIEAGFDKILNDPNKGVVYELQALKKKIDELGKNIQSPATDMLDGVAENLKDSMSTLIEEFKSSVSGEAKKELENLVSLLSESGEVLQKLPEFLEETMKTVSEDVDKTIGSYGEAITGLQDRQSELMEQQKTNIETTSSTLLEFGAMVDGMTTLLKAINETQTQYNHVRESLENTSENLNSITTKLEGSMETLNETQDSFKTYSEEYQESQSGIIDRINESLNQAAQVHSEYSENFEGIKEGLSSIFNQIKNELEGYQNAVNASMESFITKYTEALNGAVQTLSGATENQREVQNELLEELADKIDRLRDSLQ